MFSLFQPLDTPKMYANIKKYFLREKFQTVPESRFVGMNVERLDLT